jgi:protein subunit release factor A
MKKSITLELRDAEGGSDAKLLVHDMKDIYIKAAKTNNFN